LQYFAIVFLKLSRKKYLSAACLLANYLFAACLLAYANLLQREKEKGKKKQTHESNKDWGPWGSEFVFFCFFLFFGFLSFCFYWFLGFLVFWFVVGFFEGLAKQHKSEGPRPHSLPVLPL